MKTNTKNKTVDTVLVIISIVLYATAAVIYGTMSALHFKTLHDQLVNEAK